VHPHRSNALDGAAAALTVARTRGVAMPLDCHGLGLISLRAARVSGSALALRGTFDRTDVPRSCVV
jgi:hypothetical protein